jgi:hypothetical protein
MVVEFLMTIPWWIVLFPLAWLLATPVILVVVLFSDSLYPKAAVENYRWVTRCWADWGMGILP